jgi:hypothetical protein
MFSWIKKQFSRMWNFVKKHFHKVVAVTSSCAVISTTEMVGLYVADILFLSLAMTSLVGMIILCFAYMLVIFGSIMLGLQVFEFFWMKLQIKENEEISTTEEESTDIESLNMKPFELVDEGVKVGPIAAAILAHQRI